MGGSKAEEVEVKLRFHSASVARTELDRLGAREVQSRTFEDNILFERLRDCLTAAGKLLRLRRFGDEAFVTFKGPVPGVHRYKVREEHETPVGDADAAERIFTHLGFTPFYRYQKYRTLFRLEELEICLDETPIGCFVELEGRPEEIDRAAEALGLTAGDYVLASYRELHEQAARERGEEPGDLVFVDEAGGQI